MEAIHYRYADVDGRRLFYREAGLADAPALVLLHGMAVAITNVGADTLARSLALELAAPIRVIAISPGAIDTGAWDALGERDRVEVYLDGARLRLEPGQSVIPHGVDRDLTLDEAPPGGPL